MSGDNGAAAAATEQPTREIVRKQPKPLSLRDPGQLARAFAESGYWKHVKTPAQAVVIMAAGEELGLTPLASMQGITMIEGNIGYRGNLIAQLLRQHEHYDYKVIERTDERCTLQFTYDGEPFDDADEGKVTFTVEDAKRQELVKPRSNWVKTPRAMCFNRCLTEGARVYAPDLTMGTPVYSTEEVEEVITEPVVIDAEVVEETGETPAEAPAHVAPLKRLIRLASPSLDSLGPGYLNGLNAILGTLDLRAKMIDFGKLDEGLAALTEEEAKALAEELQGLLVQQVEGFNAAIQDRSQELGKLGAEGNWHDGLNVLLGSIGLDAIPPGQDFAQALAAFTPEQRQAIEEELERIALNAEIAEEEAEHASA